MIVFAICASLCLVAGQNFLFGHLPNRQINFNSIDFPQPTQVRDPRQNRGKFFLIIILRLTKFLSL